MSRQAQAAQPGVEQLRHGLAALDSQGEATRNRLLRRVDWRFLTPNPWPGCSVVFSSGRLAEAVRYISAASVEPGAVSEAQCDLAVATNPDRMTIEAAWEALQPGGAFYAEWYSPLPGGRKGVAARLEAAGFENIHTYWPWPLPERSSPGFWLPLDSTPALRHFLSHRPPAKTLPSRLGRPILQAVWRLGQRAGLLIPVCAVGIKPASQKTIQRDPHRARGQSRAIETIAPDAARHWLLLTGGLHSANKVIALVFTGGAEQPEMVVKMPRSQQAFLPLAREAAALRAMQQAAPEGLAGVPQVAFLDTESRCPALGESYLEGAPLYTRMNAGNMRRLAGEATNWIAARVSREQIHDPADQWERLVAPVLRDFEQFFGAVINPPILKQAKACLTGLQPLPVTVEQRDFSPWNILLSPQGELIVLDWENAEPKGLPVSDVAYFLTYLAFFASGAMDSGEFRQVYRDQVLDPATPLGGLVADCMRIYLQITGLPDQVVRPLRLLTWMRQACNEYRLITSANENEPEPDLLRRSLFLTLLEEEIKREPSG